jgi:protoporphyrinogen oxidase
MTRPVPPEEVIHASRSLRQRAMVLVYLVLEEDRFSEFDAHYLPSPETRITRLSEPKNYSGAGAPPGRTVLCAEIPCFPGEESWVLPEKELGRIVQEELARIGLPVQSRILGTTVRRLPSAYPVYDLGYEGHLERIEAWVDGLPGVVSFGRQGLFTHDNTHHALFTALSAVRCLGDEGVFDRARWSGLRQVFATHVVED